MSTQRLTLFQPEYLHETGGRSHNEDTVLPVNPGPEDQLYMVCDGVGGQNKGEVASALVCDYFSRYFRENPDGVVHKRSFELALSFTETHMQHYLQKHPDCEGMATTLALLYLSKDGSGAHLFWVGDSRVYHIRNGEILFHTKDHSQVQNLLDMGEIGPEEVQHHPKKNVILRAINGVSPARPDYQKLKDIRTNDFFMLCSDGILERLSHDQIATWFTKDAGPTVLRQRVLENAVGQTRDNFSMYLIKIKTIERDGPPPPILNRLRMFFKTSGSK